METAIIEADDSFAVLCQRIRHSISNLVSIKTFLEAAQSAPSEEARREVDRLRPTVIELADLTIKCLETIHFSDGRDKCKLQ